MAANDVVINIKTNTQGAVTNLRNFQTEWIQLASKVELAMFAGQAIFDVLESIYDVAKEGAIGDAALEFEEFEANMASAKQEGQSLLTDMILPLIEGYNDLVENTDAANNNYERQAILLGLVTNEQLKFSEGVKKASENLALIKPAADEAGLSIETMGDNVEDAFRAIGATSDEARLAIIRFKLATGEMNEEQATTERLLLALDGAYKLGLVDLDKLAAAMMDGVLTTEEFADVLKEQAPAVDEFGDEAAFLADQVDRMQGHHNVTIDFNVTGLDVLQSAQNTVNEMQANQGDAFPGSTPPPPSQPPPPTRGASGLDFVVPPGYPNDSFGPVFVQSGEHVKVTPAGETAQAAAAPPVVIVTLDSEQIAARTQVLQGRDLRLALSGGGAQVGV